MDKIYYKKYAKYKNKYIELSGGSSSTPVHTNKYVEKCNKLKTKIINIALFIHPDKIILEGDKTQCIIHYNEFKENFLKELNSISKLFLSYNSNSSELDELFNEIDKYVDEYIKDCFINQEFLNDIILKLQKINKLIISLPKDDKQLSTADDQPLSKDDQFKVILEGIGIHYEESDMKFLKGLPEDSKETLISLFQLMKNDMPTGIVNLIPILKKIEIIINKKIIINILHNLKVSNNKLKLFDLCLCLEDYNLTDLLSKYNDNVKFEKIKNILLFISRQASPSVSSDSKDYLAIFLMLNEDDIEYITNFSQLLIYPDFYHDLFKIYNMNGDTYEYNKIVKDGLNNFKKKEYICDKDFINEVNLLLNKKYTTDKSILLSQYLEFIKLKVIFSKKCKKNSESSSKSFLKSLW